MYIAEQPRERQTAKAHACARFRFPGNGKISSLQLRTQVGISSLQTELAARVANRRLHATNSE